MTYPFIPPMFIIVFIAYVLYLVIIKKDKKQLRLVVPIGLIFTLIWAVLYYLLFK